MKSFAAGSRCASPLSRPTGSAALPLDASALGGAGGVGRPRPLPLIDPGQRIRATVIGASQFTVQVSGKTIYLPDPYVLPVHNVPVLRVDLDCDGVLDSDRLAAAVRAGIDEIDLDHN